MKTNRLNKKAYKNLIESGVLSPCQEKVVNVLSYTDRASSEQIAPLAKIKEGTASGRVSELKDMKILVVVEKGINKTGEPADRVSLAPQYKH